MKKIISLLLLAIPTMGWCAIGDTFEIVSKEGVNLTFKITSETRKEVQFGIGDSKHVSIDSTYAGSIVIPDDANGYHVTSIADYAFYNCKYLTSIKCPDDAVTIGKRAFYNCESAKQIKISPNTTAIGERAFYGCHGLSMFFIPKNVTVIEDYTFYNCDNLVYVQIPDGVTKIGSRAFYGCSAFPQIILPDGLLSIGSYAFMGCEGLEMIVIPDNVTSVGSYAFRNCLDLESVVVGKNISKSGSYIFRGCQSLRTIYSLSETPSVMGTDFYYSSSSSTKNQIYDNATLYVPKNSVNAYLSADGWNRFKNIVGMDFTGVSHAIVDDADTIVGYYSLKGERLGGPRKGVNIVKYKNGTTKKIVIK